MAPRGASADRRESAQVADTADAEASHRDMALRLKSSPGMDITEDATTVLAQPNATAIIVLGLAVLALVLWMGSGRVRCLARLSTRSFWCPLKGRNVSAEFLEASDGTRVCVNSCDAFAPPASVACNKLCLRLRKLPPLRNRIA